MAPLIVPPVVLNEFFRDLSKFNSTLNASILKTQKEKQ